MPSKVLVKANIIDTVLHRRLHLILVSLFGAYHATSSVRRTGAVLGVSVPRF